MNKSQQYFDLMFRMSSQNLPRLVKQFLSDDWLGNRIPDHLIVDYEAKHSIVDWFSEWIPKCQSELIAKWTGDEPKQFWYYPEIIVGIEIRAPSSRVGLRL